MPKTKQKAPIHDPTKDRLTFRVLRLIAGETARQAVEGTAATDEAGRGISPSTVRNLRRPVKDGGTRYPRASTLTRLCEAHGCRLDIVTQEGKIWK